MKLSSRSTNDLKEFVFLNEPKMMRSTRSDGVPNLATIDRRQEKEGSPTSLIEKFFHAHYISVCRLPLIKYITTFIQAAGLKKIDYICYC